MWVIWVQILQLHSRILFQPPGFTDLVEPAAGLSRQLEHNLGKESYYLDLDYPTLPKWLDFITHLLGHHYTVHSHNRSLCSRLCLVKKSVEIAENLHLAGLEVFGHVIIPQSSRSRTARLRLSHPPHLIGRVRG